MKFPLSISSFYNSLFHRINFLQPYAGAGKGRLLQKLLNLIKTSLHFLFFPPDEFWLR